MTDLDFFCKKKAHDRLSVSLVSSKKNRGNKQYDNTVRDGNNCGLALRRNYFLRPKFDRRTEDPSALLSALRSAEANHSDAIRTLTATLDPEKIIGTRALRRTSRIAITYTAHNIYKEIEATTPNLVY
jgi:hypothetical protein